MKALVAAFLLLITGINSAQTTHPTQRNADSRCDVILKADSTLYANGKEAKIDGVSVCDNGKLAAFHSFTEPAFGSVQAAPTTWNYSGEIDKDMMVDLKRIMKREDIARLPESVNAVETPSPVDVTMRFTIRDQGAEKTITVYLPSLACGLDRPKVPNAVWDLICLFTDLHERAKTGPPSPESRCGCKLLHDMIPAQHAGLR